jgi:hypothetical protein
MIYLADTFYWHDPNFPAMEALRVTATTVGKWCRYYDARLLAPRKCDSAEVNRWGRLPDAPGDRVAFIGSLLEWLERCSVVWTFRLVMDDSPIEKETLEDPTFALYDELGALELNLTREEFADLQAAWRAAGLPDDLLAPAGEFFCIPWPGEGLFARLLRVLGVQKCYSPREAMHAGVTKGKR